VVNEFPQTDSARDALSYTAASFNRLKRTDDAVTSYEQFLRQYPNAPNLERTYLNMIDALHEAARYGEALDWVRQARARFPNQLGDALALFAQLRIHLAQQQWTAVVSDAEELKKTGDLGGNRVPGGTTTAEVLFLQGFALEQGGNFDQAIEVYLSIPDGRNEYSGQRATDRLRALAANPSSREALQAQALRLSDEAAKASQNGQHDAARRAAQNAMRLLDGAHSDQMLSVLRTSYAALPAYGFPNLNVITLGQRDVITEASPREATPAAIASELLFLGVYDEAIPAYIAAQSTIASGTARTAQPQPTPSDTDYTIAVFALRGGLANIAVRFGERLWRTIPADYVLSIAPKEFIDLLYPAPHAQSLVKHAQPRGVDPRFILSIARQESHFQADAKSVAAARGMTQFIAETADQVAHELGKENFQPDELYNPDTAILFAAQYLSKLFRQFPGQPQAVAGAYNGGADNISRWMARSRSLAPERYVAEIGFAQTKDYVFRVMTNYRAYQQLYDSILKRQ
jgi:soluble lytic murein transglycosylase